MPEEERGSDRRLENCIMSYIIQLIRTKEDEMGMT
jgi:hypothetical protein